MSERSFTMEMDADEFSSIISNAESLKGDGIMLRLKDDRWLLRQADGSGTMLYSAMVPLEDMKDYSHEGVSRIALEEDKIGTIASKADGSVRLELSDYRLTCKTSLGTISIPTIDPDTIGTSPDQTPNVNYSVKFSGDTSFIGDFASAADDIVSHASSYLIGFTKYGVYLQCVGDTDKFSTFKSAEEIEDYSVDFSQSIQVEGLDMVASIMGIDRTGLVNFSSNSDKFEAGMEVPMKVVYSTGESIKHSYITTPRIDSDGVGSVVNNEMLLEEVSEYAG